MRAAPLAIPDDVLKQHVVIFGKTGSGKSSVLRHMVEHLLSQKKRVCIIDPKGDWWGLPSAADGESPGFKVVLFGDFKGERSDVPMDSRAGKEVAQIIATSDQACVLGFRGWMPGDLTRFWLEFAPELFNKNAGELYLVIDEAHNFAPKGKIMSPDSAKMLHWTNRLASEGRGLGMKLLIASQRPQKLHNDTASCCETLIAMRVVHPRDRAAIKDWIDENATSDSSAARLLSEIPRMSVGEGWVWFPDGDYLKCIKFPMFRSFDSFSEQASLVPLTWAKVDVEAVRQKLARVVQEKEASDPKKLQARISELVLRLNSIALSAGMEIPKEWTAPQLNLLASTVHQRVQPMAPEPAEPEVVHLIDARELSRLEKVTDTTTKQMAYLQKELAEFKQEIDARAKKRPETKPAQVSTGLTFPASLPPSPTPFKARPERGAGIEASDGNLGAMQRAFLTALAQYEARGLTKSQILVLTDYRSSGPVSKCFAQLHRDGWMTTGGAGKCYITRAGLNVLGDFERLPTGAALRVLLLNGNKTSQMEKAFLKVAFDAYPNAISKGDMLNATGYKSSGPVSKCFAKLVRIEYLKSEGPAMLKASDTFFQQ